MTKEKTKINALKKSMQNFKFSLVRLTFFVLICAVAVAGGLIFKTPLESILNSQESSISQATIDYNGLLVHFIDVGQGDAIAIEFPDNKKMLIDAGPESSKTELIGYLNNNVFDRAEEKINPTIDYLLLTHPDDDHCGGMPAVMENFQVNKVFRPQAYSSLADKERDANAPSNPFIKDTAIFRDTIDAYYDEPDCTVQFIRLSEMNSASRIFGGIEDDYYHFTFYGPEITTVGPTLSNDFSPIMVLEYRDKLIMFTGDCSQNVETDIINRHPLPDVDILKVSHHGSASSSSQAFLNVIRPDYAIIQVGVNSFGHPTQTTLNRLLSVGAEVYRNDINNNIIANVQTNNRLVVYGDIINESYQIKIEYVIIGICLLTGALCFIVDFKTNSSSGDKKSKNGGKKQKKKGKIPIFTDKVAR